MLVGGDDLASLAHPIAIGILNMNIRDTFEEIGNLAYEADYRSYNSYYRI